MTTSTMLPDGLRYGAWLPSQVGSWVTRLVHLRRGHWMVMTNMCLSNIADMASVVLARRHPFIGAVLSGLHDMDRDTQLMVCRLVTDSSVPYRVTYNVFRVAMLDARRRRQR